MNKVYISGPISGVDRDIYMSYFDKAEKMLTEQGYKAVNPTKFILCRYPWLYKIVGYRLTLLYDLWRLMHCDKIYKIPGWKESRGANIESCVAYHFRIWPVPSKETEKFDKKLAKLIDKLKGKPESQ